MYAVEVVLYSENAKVTRTSFEIEWSGKWRDSEVDMANQIKVRRMDSAPKAGSLP